MQREVIVGWTDAAQRLRKAREMRAAAEANYSLRKVAARCGITPAYLSRIERADVPPPAEETLRRLAIEVGEEPDVVLALAGKVSSDLRDVIRRRPQLFAMLIRQLRDVPDDAVLRLVREVKDGNW